MTNAPKVQQLDPRALLVDRNARVTTRVEDDTDFLASIRKYGVLQPIIAVRTADDAVRVRFGHRRTLAAVLTEQDTIPVVVVADEGTQDDDEIERIITQHHENAFRAGLTAADEVAEVEQLTAFGLSADTIANFLHLPTDRVQAARKVGTSKLATAAADRYDFLDLTQAAALAEFEDDQEALTRLIEAARHGDLHFRRQVEHQRNERQARQHHDALLARLAADGISVVDDAPGYRAQEGPARISDLLTERDGDPLDATAHADCPGRGVIIGQRYGRFYTDTGEPVSESNREYEDDYEDDYEYEDEDPDGDEVTLDEAMQVDEEDEAVPAREVASGYYPVVAGEVCIDPEAHGHVRLPRETYSGAPTGPRKKIADMAPAEAAAARAARKDVIDSNAAWRAAEPVRKEWVKALVSKTKPPRGCSTFVAAALAQDATCLTQQGARSLAEQWIGASPGNTIAAHVAKATEARAQIVGLALVLAAYEKTTHLSDWRSPKDSTVRYLTYLAACGYDLADVERRACGLPVTSESEPDQAEGQADNEDDGQDPTDEQAEDLAA